ncbi:MAG: glycosyltransferase [Oscillibacter sp.]|nr:glycosyltransferase [Oscillibacter sp.]
MNILLSIIVPVYGVEKYIERCAKSLFNDFHDSIEIIFINDCTQDRSLEILNQVISSHSNIINTNNVVIVSHPVNNGLAASRLTGLKIARGNYVMFLDSDDELAASSLGLILNWLKSKPDVIVVGMMDIFFDKKIFSPLNNTIQTDVKSFIKSILARDCLGTICGKIFRKALFNEKTQFIEGINYGEDYVTLPRVLSLANSIMDKTEYPIYLYHHDREDSFTAKYIGRGYVDQLIKAVDVLIAYFSADKTLLDTIKIRNRIFLLEYCQYNCIEYVKAALPIPRISLRDIPLKHRLVAYLSKFKWNAPLILFLKISRWIKNKFRI